MSHSLPSDRLGIGAYATSWPAPGKPGPRRADPRRTAVELESIGVDSVWVADELGFWEPWSLLPAIAAATSRVELGRCRRGLGQVPT